MILYQGPWARVAHLLWWWEGRTIMGSGLSKGSGFILCTTTFLHQPHWLDHSAKSTGRHCVPKRKKKRTNAILSYPLTLKQVIEQLANKHFLIKLSSVSETIWGLTEDSLCAEIMQVWTRRQRKTTLQSQVSHKVANWYKCIE